jgi:hypothetical protein
VRISRPLFVPDLIPPRNFYRFRWSELLGTAVTRSPHHPASASASLFRQIAVCPRRFAVHALAASLLLHLVGYAFFPKFFSRFAPSSTAAALISDENKIVYYHFSKQEPRGPIPRMLPPGPRSVPGIGSDPRRAPAKGATKALGTLFAVSRPRLPDNSHQTILQHNRPPELRIKKDLKLPNIIFAEPLVPKPPLHFDANNVRPLRRTKRQHSDNAPLLSMLDTQKPVAGLLVSAISNLHLAAPVGAPRAPLPASQSGEMSGETAAPQTEASRTNGIDLVILSTDPAGSAASVALPLGDRYGEFLIAPGGSEHGSPSEAGTGGNGLGGNGSTSASFLRIEDAAARKDGRVAVVGWAVTNSGTLAAFVADVSVAQRSAQIIQTSPFEGQAVGFGPDGTIWVLGLEVGPGRGREPAPDHHMVQHFGTDDVLKDQHLLRSNFDCELAREINGIPNRRRSVGVARTEVHSERVR